MKLEQVKKELKKGKVQIDILKKIIENNHINQNPQE